MGFRAQMTLGRGRPIGIYINIINRIGGMYYIGKIFVTNLHRSTSDLNQIQCSEVNTLVSRSPESVRLHGFAGSRIGSLIRN